MLQIFASYFCVKYKLFWISQWDEISNHNKCVCFSIFKFLSLQSSDGSDDIFNDYVTLGKSTEFKEVVWLFPKTDQCPLKDCMLSCSSRSVCLGHFHLKHADKTMICTVCNELVSVKNPLNLFRHYQDYHPNEPPPKLKSKVRDARL